MSYQETIDYLFGLQKHGIKFGLANSHALMDLMGSPHRKFRSVHVAGTNGKGSTSAFLAGMLSAAGHRVGLYTSPHLISFTERIRINNVRISEQRVVELAERVRAQIPRIPAGTGEALHSPTFFEVTTAMAFTHFADEGVDIVVVETGMGGRLDSTNVITPLVSVITNIDLEHTEFLGTSIGQIAFEKAGIIKQGVPVVTAIAQPEAVRIVEQTAADRSAPLYRMGRDFSPENIIRGRRQSFDHRGIAAQYKDLHIAMLGMHQIDNACLATAAAECLMQAGVGMDEDALRTGLGQTVWEGRLERVSERPDIYLDGAHNPASARVLAAAIRDMKPSYRRLILVTGILADKDYRGILTELVPLADRVIVTRPQYSRAMDVERLASEIRPLHQAVDSAETVAGAIGKAREAASSDDLILVTGSLYTVGDARAVFVSDGQAQGLKGLKG